MQVKIFEAQNMASGLKMVKKSLGPDALILSTRTVRKGRLGMLSRPILEITAAVDKPWQEKETTPALRTSLYPPSPHNGNNVRYPSNEIGNNNNGTNYLHSSSQFSSESQENNFKREIGELRDIVMELSKKISIQNHNHSSIISPKTNTEEHHSGFRAGHSIVHFLMNRGVNQEAARTIADFASQKMEDGVPMDLNGLKNFLTGAIAGLFQINTLEPSKQRTQKRIALTGPTGVGKTTTIAKIAANYLGRYGNNIALITIDTYRIAAVEQLKVYGEIMNLPVEVVIRPKDLNYALKKHQDRDLILIDTAGRNPRNKKDLDELIDFLQPKLALENHMVLSATTRESELNESINKFSSLPIDNIIFSKIDECNLLGTILNMQIKNNFSISFLTNGQKVPEDLITPTPEIIANLIIDQHGAAYNG
ncbi:MAG: flagellar biosynthesis protein FlhF [Desulfobulbaceae bacterium]|nr:flagellar biosynthesis protein FlhF [Desulfobulbaceae bacterium]